MSVNKIFSLHLSVIQTDLHYPGASDTIVSSLGAFIIAMLMNPDVQNKAHDELERVLGPGDLPSFSDEPTLPYITAIVQEVLRHNPVAPLGACALCFRNILTDLKLGFPHRLAEDDIYEGYFIPKGSIIMANVWYFDMLSVAVITLLIYSTC